MKNVKKFQDKLWKSALRWTDFELTFTSYFLQAVSHAESLQCFDTKPDFARVRSHAPSIQSHRGTKVVWPDFQPMRVLEEPVCIDLFRQNPVFTSLHFKSPVHVHRLSPESTPRLHLNNKHSCPHSIQLLKYVLFVYYRVHWVGLFWQKLGRLLTRKWLPIWNQGHFYKRQYLFLN